MTGNGHRLHQGLDWILGKILHRQVCKALKQTAQENAGVTIPGSVQKTCRWHLGIWFSAGLDSANLGVGLSDLFQPKQF